MEVFLSLFAFSRDFRLVEIPPLMPMEDAWELVLTRYWGERMSCFNDNLLYYILGFTNAHIVMEMLSALAPTINFQAGDIANLPVIVDTNKKSDVEDIVHENVKLSKLDWDSFETSWDFERHPLI